MNVLPGCRRRVQNVKRNYRQPGIGRQVTDNAVRIDHRRGHQMSSLGKFRQVSRRFSSISSADNEIARSAHRSLTLLKGILFPASSRSRPHAAKLLSVSQPVTPGLLQGSPFRVTWEPQFHYQPRRTSPSIKTGGAGNQHRQIIRYAKSE